MITTHQFLHYIHLLNHPDNRQRIDALQDLFFLLLRGELLHPNQWEQLIPVLITNIAHSNDVTLRRWAYQVGSFSINNNKILVDYCINTFDKEKDSENLSWIAAILSKNLSKKTFYDVISKKNHKLTNENIALATYLFCDYSHIDIKNVLKNSDPLSLMWLASIGAYKNIAIHNKREIIIHPKELTLLTGETDNDEVLKHIMYAFFLQKTFSTKELLFSPYEYHKMGNQQKKWFFSLIWKDTKFLLKNIDYIKELLSEKHLFHHINDEVRIGLARGLAESKFIKEISSNIIEWYSHENSTSVLYFLLKYFQRYENMLDDYKDIVEYQKMNGQEFLKELVFVCEDTNMDFLSAKTIDNLQINGGKIMKLKLNNPKQVNIFNGSNNQAYFYESDFIDWQALKKELEEIIEKCNNDEKSNLQIVLDAINQKDEFNFKNALKKVVNIGIDIFSNVTATVLTAYMKSHGIIP